MDAGILCQLIANKIDPTKFQLWGLEIKWLEDPTPEELAIVDDVIKNYPSLEAEYLLEESFKKENSDLISHLIDNDIKCIRAIREWIIGASAGTVSALRIYDVVAQQGRDRLNEIKISKL